MTFPLDQIPPGRSRTLGTSFAPDNATAHRLAGFVAEPDGAKRILVVTSSRENAYMDYSRRPPSAAKGIDMSWPDRRVADALAERVASLPPVMQRADQELARLSQALVQAWAEIAELRVLADHDSLTGLANRRRMMAELEDVVEDCRRHGGDASLVFMDLNRLKLLNESHGHQEIGRAHVELQSLMRISYAVFCLKNKKPHKI